MAKNDFNIIIGAKFIETADSIQKMIDDVSKSYTVNLKAVLSNEDETSKSIGRIIKLLNDVESTNINIDNKSLKETERLAESSTKKAKKGVEETSGEVKDLQSELSKVLNSFKQIETLSEKVRVQKKGKRNVKTITNVEGNDFYTHTERLVEGKNGKKKTSDEYFRNYQKLNKEIDKLTTGLDKVRQNGYIAVGEIDKLESEIRSLSNMDMSSNEFTNAVNDVRNKYSIVLDYEKQLKSQQLDRENAVNKVQKERLSWEQKIQSLELKGYTHWKQMESLKKQLKSLDDSNLQTLEDVNKHLEKMNQQYAKAVKYQQNLKFKTGAVEKSNQQREKIDNINPEFLGNNGEEEINRLNELAKNIAKAENMQEMTKAVQKAINLYSELIEQQKTSIDLTKMSNKYNEQLENINFKSDTQLKDEKNRAIVAEKIRDIQNQINMYQQRGTELGIEEQKNLRENINYLNKLITTVKGLESEQQRVVNQTERLKKEFESVSYRASRGFNKNIQELNEVRKIINSIEKDINSLEAENLIGDNFDDRYKKIQSDMNRLNKTSRELRDNVREQENSFIGRFQHAMNQVPVWISAMTLFYGAMAQVRAGFESLLEIDSAMINLGKVTEATNTELERFRTTASEIGYNLGVTTAEVINATTEFQKLGFSIKQASLLAESSILYANVGDMDIESATQSIVSAVKGFNIEIDESGESVQRLVDIFNEVSNNFAITSEGIGQALQRSSAVLNQAGNSIEQSVALVTSANTTIQDPMKVGNALKTISMRLRGVAEDGQEVAGLVPELESAFKAIDLSLYEEGTTDTFKSTFEIFDVLAEKWSTLSDLQQAYFTELIGGKEQGAIVASMIQNWNDALKSHETALNSAGSAQREFQSYTEGFEYKINQLKVALEEFWMALIDDEFAKAFIDFLTNAVNMMTRFVETFGSEAVVANIAGLFAILTNPSLKGRFFNFDKDEMMELRNQIKGTDKEFTKSTDRWKSQMSGVGSMIGMVGGRLLGIIVIITLVAKAITFVTDLATKESRERRERIKTLEDEITKYEQLKETLESINVNRYFELDNIGKRNLNTEELEEYIQIEQQLIEQMPEIVSSYNEQGEAVLKNADAIKELLDRKEELYAQNLQEKYENESQEIDISEIEDNITDIKNLTRDSIWASQEREAYLFAEEFIEANKDRLKTGSNELQDALQELFDGMNSKLGEDNINKEYLMNQIFPEEISKPIATGNADEALKYVTEFTNELQKKSEELKSQIDSEEHSLRNSMEYYSTLLQDAVNIYLMNNNIDVKSSEALFINNIRKKLEEDFSELGVDVRDFLKEFPKIITDTMSELEESNIDVNELFETSFNENEINNKFDTLITKLNDGTVYGNKFVEMLKEMKQEQLDALDNIGDAKIVDFSWAKSVTPVINEFENSIRGLDSSYRQLAEGQQLSMSQVFDLIENYPELTKHLEFHNGAIRLSQKAIEDLAKVKEAEFKRDIEIKRKEAENAKESARKQIEAIMSIVKAEEIKGNARVKSASTATETAKALREEAKIAYELGQYQNYDYLMGQAKSLEEQVGIIVDLNGEISALEGLLNTDFSSNLGSINSINSSKSAMQDATYVSDEYALALDRINNAISIQQAKQERYANYSANYQKSIREEINLNKQKKNLIDNEIKSLEQQIKKQQIQETGMISLGKTENKTDRAKQAELRQKIDEAKKELNSLVVESENVQQTIYSLNTALIESNTEMFNNKRASLDDDIAHAEYSMSLYAEGSKSYIRYAETQIEYMKEIQRQHQLELAYLEKTKKENKDLTEAQIEQLNQLIRESRQAVYSSITDVMNLQQALSEVKINSVFDRFEEDAERVSDAIEDIRNKINYDLEDDKDYAKRINYLKEILALTKGQASMANRNIVELKEMKKEYGDNHELTEKISEEIKKWQDELKNSSIEVKQLNKEISNAYENMADEFVDIYKEQLQLMQRAEEEHYEDSMELQEKAHNNRIKHLEEELETIRKIYNDRMELIDREESTRTYNNDIEELQKEAKELQKTIDELSLDGSFEAQSKRSELIKRQEELNLKIAERQHEREIELRKQNLEDDLEAQEESLESQKDAYEEDYNKFVENEKKKKEARDKYWESMLNDERKFNSLREEIINGSFNNVLSMVEDWSSEVKDEMSVLGETITNNFTDRIDEAIASLRELKSLNVGSLKDVISVDEKGLGSSGNKDRKTQLNEEDYKLLSGKFLSSELRKYATTESQSKILQQRASSLTREARENGAQLDPNITETYEDLMKTLAEEEKVLMAKYIQENTLDYIKSPHLREALMEMTNEIISENEDLWSGEDFLESLNKYLNGFAEGGYTGKGNKNGRITKVHDEELILDKKNSLTLKNFLGTDSISSRINEMLNDNKVVKAITNSISRIASPIPLPTMERNVSNESNESQSIVYDLDIHIENLNGNRKEATIVGEQIISEIVRTRGGKY